MAGSTLIDLTGRRFGRLTVMSRDPASKKNVHWFCLCDCGNSTRVAGGNLKNGHIQSCNCLRIERTSAANKIHGNTYQNGVQGRVTPEYKAWSHAKSRCYNPKDKKYKHYGGRGISMCDEWRNDFPAFLAYMGPRPNGKTLDRIRVNGHYEPGNVFVGRLILNNAIIDAIASMSLL